MAEVRSGSFKTSIFSGAERSPSHYIFSWTLTSQSIENNTSTISWTLSAAGGLNEYYWIYIYDKYVTVNGVTKSSTAGVQSYNGTVAFSGTSTITHSSDGKGKFSASAGGAFYYSGSYNSTGSGSWDLPTIARATTPTLSATTITMGSSITVSMAPANSTFKHKLRYDFGSVSGSATGFSVGEGFTTQGNSSATFTPPTSLGSQIPSAMSGKGTLYCYTYASNGTHIGTKTVSITLNVPSYTPTISGITLTGNNLLSSTYVQGKSTVTVSATLGRSYGATTKSVSAVIDGKTYTSLPFTTSALTTGSKSAAITFTDSRNKSVTVTSSAITVYAYSIPSITSFTMERQSNGTSVVATVQGTIASVNSKNAKTIKVTLNGVTNTITSSSYTISATTTFTNVPTDNTLNATASFADSYTTVTKSATLPTVAVTMDFHNSGKGIALGKVAETEGLLDISWETKISEPLTVGKGIKTEASLEVSSPTFGATLINRNDSANAATIRFANTNGVLGAIGMSTTPNTGLRRWTADTSGTYFVLDTGNLTDYIKDYVVERGTSGIWTYEKWDSGVAKCYGTHPVSNVTVNSGWGSIYSSPQITLPNFPFTFKATPSVTLTWNGTYSAIIDGATGITTVRCGYTYLFRPDSTTLTTGGIAIQAIGKWK